MPLDIVEEIIRRRMHHEFMNGFQYRGLLVTSFYKDSLHLTRSDQTGHMDVVVVQKMRIRNTTICEEINKQVHAYIYQQALREMQDFHNYQPDFDEEN